MNTPDQHSQIFLSVIIASYNSSQALSNNLGGLISFLKTKTFSWEIIIVDDGSVDGNETLKVATANNCRYEKNEINMGKGAAIRKGMLSAKGRFRIFTDVDIPFQYKSIDQFIYYLDFKEFDIVVGDRTLPGSSYFTEIPLIRKFGSKIFTFIVGRFVTTGLFDTQCGLKGFSAAIAENLFSVSRIDGFAFDVEIIYIALKYNYDIKRLPVQLRSQEGSSVSLLKHGVGMFLDLFRIKLNHVQGKYKLKWSEK